MRLVLTGLAATIGVLLSPSLCLAQSSPSQSTPSMSVPRLINISGVIRPADGESLTPIKTVTLAIYDEETGGAPLWTETQNVAVQPSGRYTVMLGATTPDGIPMDVFVSGGPRWLGITWLHTGSGEEPRTRFTSVPYALRAADADTLGGKPPSAYLLAPQPGEEITTAAPNASDAPTVVVPGTPGFLAKYVNSADVGDSAVFETGGRVGVNTTTPLDVIHSRFTDSTGSQTGLVVQNLSSAATAYSGMLFRDQNGAVGLFQGFNNTTHEYRINNVASGGHINFMVGSTTRFKVDATGSILIGTTAPEVGTFLQAGLVVRQGASHGIFVRKPATDPSNAAIHARSAPGVSGVLIKSLVGIADNTDEGGNAAIIASNTTSAGVGLFAHADVPTGTGLLASGGFRAAEFVGNVTVSGTLTKGGGAFQIDHPLDPENKYLLHSFVESPDMMNIYNGNVTLDAQGHATVTLPEWFQPLNRDFRYQLTAIGAAAPNLHVSQEVSGNTFAIGGGVAHGKVSWQVTGIRQDAWANANRIQVEKDKNATEGTADANPRPSVIRR